MNAQPAPFSGHFNRTKIAVRFQVRRWISQSVLVAKELLDGFECFLQAIIFACRQNKAPSLGGKFVQDRATLWGGLEDRIRVQCKDRCLGPQGGFLRGSQCPLTGSIHAVGNENDDTPGNPKPVRLTKLAAGDDMAS